MFSASMEYYIKLIVWKSRRAKPFVGLFTAFSNTSIIIVSWLRFKEYSLVAKNINIKA